jgi:hypothetical protein
MDAQTWTQLETLPVGYTVQRMSRTTYVRDIANTHEKADDAESGKSFAIAAWAVRSGLCYRVRIAKGPYFYDKTAQGAAEQALKDYRARQ